MTLDQLTELFKWMTIIHIVIFVSSALLSMILRSALDTNMTIWMIVIHLKSSVS